MGIIEMRGDVVLRWACWGFVLGCVLGCVVWIFASSKSMEKKKLGVLLYFGSGRFHLLLIGYLWRNGRELLGALGYHGDFGY